MHSSLFAYGTLRQFPCQHNIEPCCLFVFAALCAASILFCQLPLFPLLLLSGASFAFATGFGSSMGKNV